MVSSKDPSGAGDVGPRGSKHNPKNYCDTKWMSDLSAVDWMMASQPSFDRNLLEMFLCEETES